MAADDLSKPLGRGPINKRLKLPVAPATLLAGALSLVIVTFLGWTLFVSDPQGGEPSATVSLPSSSATSDPKAMASSEGQGKPDVTTPEGAQTGKEAGGTQNVVTIIDGSTGKRQEVQLSNGEGKPGGGDPRLLESTRHGLIPKIGPDGTRPADAYAISRGNNETTDAPRISIIITGLGIGAKLTDTAIAKLPGTVTLAFVPYTADLDAMAAKAREAGHELLLQVPMEPVDYPDNDPGPQTLLTSLPAEQNIDRLYWAMSRMRGYVGIMNYMGARFTASEAAISPVLKETSKRGLVYFDDAASARSMTAQFAGANNLAYAKADVVIDAVPTAAEIGKALTRLAGIAKTNGTAVGVASALPVSIERIAQWAKTIKGTGFILVPISVAAARSKSS
ncbi:MAG: divergent polysaccharide deacetylase family protein [Xanthobacteraceae bacterium]